MNTKHSALFIVLLLLLLGLTLLVWTIDLTATAQEAEVNTHIPMASNISNAESFGKLDNQSVSDWHIQRLDSTDDVGEYTSLALDKDGYAHICYYDVTNGDLKYIVQNASAWLNETVDSTGDVGKHTSLALNGEGYPHISYFDSTNGNLKYAYQDTFGWHIQTIDSAGIVGEYTSIAMDESGYPHISYYDASFMHLRYAYRDVSGWHYEVVDSEDWVGEYSSLALDGNGYPHISYYHSYNIRDLKYAYKDASGWHIQTVDSAGYVGKYTSLALDESGYPHISYSYEYNMNNNMNLKYAYQDVSGWHSQTVDDNPYVGYYTSLTLNKMGYPHISYYDGLSNLKYAYQDVSGWHNETVDMAGYVGKYSSLVLDESDYPHISYRDWSDNDLKYAFYFAPMLEVTKQGHPNPVEAGEQLTYTLYVTNTGNVNLHAIITDTLPAHVVPNGILTWTPTITAFGGIWTTQAVVTVELGYAGLLTNVVQVNTAEGATGSVTATSISLSPCFEVTKDISPDSVQAGTQLTYSLHITNTGNINLHATVTDTLPTHVTPTGILTWTPTITAPGGIWMAQYVVTVEMGYAGPLTNVVQVTTVEGATGTYTATSHAQVSPELSVTKRADTDLVLPGDQLTYTLAVSNTGNVTLTATITDVLPLNVTLGETSGGSIILPPGWIVWSPVTLAPGDIWTKTVVVTVTMEAAGPLTNTVQVVAEEGAWGADTVIVAVEEGIAGLAVRNDSPTQLGDSTTLTATVAAGSNVAYLWDFGDGEMGSGDVVSHTYSNVWMYTAVVTASNSFTAMTATSTVMTTDAPVAGLSTTNDSPTPLGRSTTLTATVMAGSNVTYTWAFGDGEISYGKVVSHSYPAHGAYTAVVTASNSVNYITATTPVKIMACVYLPVILKRWPPIPYQPALYAINNADGDGNYTVSWAEQPTRLADTYILEEATNATFTIGLRTVCTTAEQACAVSGRVAGTYYYRVKGQNVWGESTWSNTQTADVLLPATPVLNAINNADGDGSYTVSWNAAARATSYVLQEDTSSTFNNPTTVFNGAQTSWSASGKAVGTYYYRVIANGPTGQSGWSATQSVSVSPPDAPYLNPISNADGDGNYSVTWGAVPGATSYTLQEDDNTAFSSPQTLYTGANQSWSATNHAQGTYYYRAAAIGSTGQSAWSNSQSVTIFPPANVRITYINYDPPGDDVAGEYVNIVNSGGRAQVMTSWTLRDIASHVFTFPSFTLAAGATVKVWTKSGTNTATDLYWGSSQAIWNNDGDTAYLRDAGGALVSSYTYP